MQIILNQTEIEQALVSYIATRLAINEGQEIVVEMTAGRGADGYRATVEIKDAAAATPAVQAPKPTPAPAPAGGITRKPKAEDPAKPEQAAAPVEQAAAPVEPKPAQAEAQGAAADAPFDGGTATSDPESGATADVAEETQQTEKPAEAPAIRKPLFGRSATALNA